MTNGGWSIENALNVNLNTLNLNVNTDALNVPPHPLPLPSDSPHPFTLHPHPIATTLPHKILLAPAGCTYKVRNGLWNCRGDHLTPEVYIVNAPPQIANPGSQTIGKYPDVDELSSIWIRHVFKKKKSKEEGLLLDLFAAIHWRSKQADRRAWKEIQGAFISRIDA
jgi:hypothetical protein